MDGRKKGRSQRCPSWPPVSQSDAVRPDSDTTAPLGRTSFSTHSRWRSFVRPRSLITTCLVTALTGASAFLGGPAQAANDQRGSAAPVVIGMVDTGVNATHQEFS